MTPVLASDFRRRIVRVAVPFAAVAGIYACGDPLAPSASQTNVNQFFAVFAITGTPTNAPAALNLVNKSTTRLDGGFDFDVAFDLNALNQAVILPLGMVGAPVGGARLVGLQRVSGAFDSLSAAPKQGYVFDSLMVVKPGAVLAIQSQVSMCAGSLTPYIFAKLVIDSINAPARTLYGRTLINLNCGLRSLAPGIPKS